MLKTTATIMLALCLAKPAFAFEAQTIEQLQSETVMAHKLVTVDQDKVCPASRQPAFCRLQFDLAMKYFELVEQRLDRIAHNHDEAGQLEQLQWAYDDYTQGLRVYSIALLENLSPDGVIPHRAAEASK